MSNKKLLIVLIGMLALCAVVVVSGVSTQHTYAAAQRPAGVRVTTIPGTCPPTLSEGSQGDEVSKLQFELNFLFGYNLPMSGYFGPETASAVRDLQSKYVPPATGVVDQRTWHFLGRC